VKDQSTSGTAVVAPEFGGIGAESGIGRYSMGQCVHVKDGVKLHGFSYF
jgi:hypothetical protein